MSDLTYFERMKLERRFNMAGGYVLDFSNRTFGEFVAESTGRDIYDARYDYASGSKANRLRAFWAQEPNPLVGKLITDLLEYSRPLSGDSDLVGLDEECERIVGRLLQDAPVDAIEAITAEGTEPSFEVLAREVRDSIEKNEPEAGLDRLHTYVTKLIRTLARKRGIATSMDRPLHSIFGQYVKALRSAGFIESEMTERILRSSIGSLEAFNDVRNNRSLAHDNPVLGYDESLLIFSHVCGVVRFVRSIERRGEKSSHGELFGETMDEDLPF